MGELFDMETQIMTKEVFLELIGKLIKKDEVIILTNRLETIKILSHKKKNYAKSYTAVYPIDLFKEQDTIADLMNNKLLGVIICESKYLNERLEKQFKEIRKEKKK